jgi:pimeloyl-ACP methyl ester carboxylesterase
VADGVGGTPIFFSSVNLGLAKRGLWTVPCPLYAIANWAKGSGFIEAESIPALARTHIEAVRRIQPRGPYRLGGYSLGGPIALEMAQQLTASGEQVEMLFLLDPMEPLHGEGLHPAWRPSGPDPLGMRVKRLVKRVAQGPQKLGLRLWLSTLVPIHRIPLFEWASYHLVHLYGRHPNAVTQWLLPSSRWRAFWFAARRMMKHYVAKPYSGRTLAVFVDDGERARTWATLLGPAADIRVESTTHNLLFEDPALGRWMGWLTQSLASKP